MEGQRKAEHAAHLQSCSACSGLVSDLSLISSRLGFFKPRRAESAGVESDRDRFAAGGLIRQPGRDRSLVLHSLGAESGLATASAAILVIAFGVTVYKGGRSQQIASNRVAAPVAMSLAANSNDDQQLLEVVDRGRFHANLVCRQFAECKCLHPRCRTNSAE